MTGPDVGERRVIVRYVGGPTALLELGGLRLPTDSTFDPPGDHPVGSRVLVKTAGPAVGPERSTALAGRSARCRTGRRDPVRRAAQTALVPDAYLTLTSEAAAEASRILGARAVVPLHFEGWTHFTQGRDTLLAAFERAGLANLLHLPRPGESVES